MVARRRPPPDRAPTLRSSAPTSTRPFRHSDVSCPYRGKQRRKRSGPVCSGSPTAEVTSRPQRPCQDPGVNSRSGLVARRRLHGSRRHHKPSDAGTPAPPVCADNHRYVKLSSASEL
jgi:hypothetical protein